MGVLALPLLEPSKGLGEIRGSYIVALKILTPCSLMESYRHVQGMYFIRPGDGGSRFFRNVVWSAGLRRCHISQDDTLFKAHDK